MSRPIAQIVNESGCGTISRRQLLVAFAAAAVVGPATTFAQGGVQGRAGGDSTGRGGGGRGRGAPRDTTPLVLPFASTGWKTVWLDHLDYQCVDYKKAAAFYATLMGWKVRSDDGKQAVLDMGDSGGIVIRGGLTVPPPAAITDAGLGVSRPPVHAVFDGFAWGIANWDAKAVEAELKKRGLNPVADNHGDYQSFKIKDPDGFTVAVTNGTKANRRKTSANAKLPTLAPFAPTNWNTLYLDHISYEVPDYRRSAAFYKALLGWEQQGTGGGGGQTTVLIGDAGVAGGAIIRGNAAARAVTAAAGRGGDTAAARASVPVPANGVTAAIGHISFGMENWNTERVREELKKRDVVYVNAQGVREPRPDMTGQLLSFHVPDAQGWDLQIGNKIGASTYIGG